ncbi:MAG: hypothetical protein O3B16_04510 [Chloroflexi bacterium]|nr:hypothetical protein [Chloroflexota bacterium]
MQAVKIGSAFVGSLNDAPRPRPEQGELLVRVAKIMLVPSG